MIKNKEYRSHARIYQKFIYEISWRSIVQWGLGIILVFLLFEVTPGLWSRESISGGLKLVVVFLLALWNYLQRNSAARAACIYSEKMEEQE